MKLLALLLGAIALIALLVFFGKGNTEPGNHGDAPSLAAQEAGDPASPQEGTVDRQPEPSVPVVVAAPTAPPLTEAETAKFRASLEAYLLTSQEHPDGAAILRSMWQGQLKLANLVFERSPDSALLEDYYFIQPEDLQGMTEAEQVLTLNYLSAEKRHLIEEGIIWKKGSDERDTKLAMEIVTGPFVLRYPPEALVGTPVFGGGKTKLPRDQADALQMTRLQMLFQYVPLDYRRGTMVALKGTPEFAGPGQVFLDSEIALIEKELAAMRRSYIVSLANIAGSPEVPEF